MNKNKQTWKQDLTDFGDLADWRFSTKSWLLFGAFNTATQLTQIMTALAQVKLSALSPNWHHPRAH